VTAPAQALAAESRLLTFEFVGLCLVSFLAFCNVAVFYDLFGYLQTLGIAAELRGLVIGAYSLTAMTLYAVASPFVSAATAKRAMLLGLAVLAATGLGYLFIESFWGLLVLRLLNGVGQFSVGAGAMALFVAVIPPEKSGQAFGIHSVAILVAYALVPALMDALAHPLASPPLGYAVATISLLPAAWIAWRVGDRYRARSAGDARRPQLPSWAETRANVTRFPVALLLLLTTIYFANWSSLFFLFKEFARQQGLANVGAFFGVQMGIMMAIRLLAGRLFDSVDKVRLVGISFLLIAAGYLALDRLPGTGAVPLIAALFGLGLGVGYPAISGLMFETSPPRFRALNANLMLFAVNAGLFLGPLVGGALVATHGFAGYFRVSVGLALVAAALGVVLARERRRAALGGS
jgi:MFS family permease